MLSPRAPLAPSELVRVPLSRAVRQPNWSEYMISWSKAWHATQRKVLHPDKHESYRRERFEYPANQPPNISIKPYSVRQRRSGLVRGAMLLIVQRSQAALAEVGLMLTIVRSR